MTVKEVIKKFKKLKNISDEGNKLKVKIAVKDSNKFFDIAHIDLYHGKKHKTIIIYSEDFIK